jgi:voltage-gated potassium channel
MFSQWGIKCRQMFQKLIRHPLLTSTIILLLIVVFVSITFYLFEKEYGAPYDTYSGTLKGILVLVMSGFDVEPPNSAVALVGAYFLMGAGIVYIGLLTSIIVVSVLESHLRKGIHVGNIKYKDHILVCGWHKSFKNLLSQLFAEDLKKHHPVVIIDASIEQAPTDYPLLKVIKGDPTDNDVLEQANAREARSAIILADRKSTDPNEADSRSLLIALAVETLQPAIYSCVEVLNPENVVHFKRINVDEVISISDISKHLIVQSALNPGISKLIMDMITFGEGEELYCVDIPPQCVGKTFVDLSVTLVKEHNIILVGVISNGKVLGADRTKWRFQEGDAIFILAEDEVKDLNSIKMDADV